VALQNENQNEVTNYLLTFEACILEHIFTSFQNIFQLISVARYPLLFSMCKCVPLFDAKYGSLNEILLIVVASFCSISIFSIRRGTLVHKYLKSK